MKSRKINYVIVGGFVIAMLAALTFSMAMLSGHSGDTEDYYVVYDNVSGVGFGTKVLFEGYHVGQVENITPVIEDGALHFRVDMSIIEGWHIPSDSVARKESGGLLSAVTIAISAGDNPEAIEVGEQIDSGVSTSLFDVVSQVASDAGDVTRTGLKPLLENINKQVALLGVMLEDDIPTLLNQLSTTASVAAERAPVILANLESFIESLNATSAKVDEILNARNVSLVNSSLENIEEGTGNFVAIAGDLQATSTNIDSMINAINEVVSGNKDNLDKTLVDLRYSMESVARHVDAISRNLEGSSRHMYEFSRQIRLNPGLLLGGKPPRDEAVAVEGAQ
ncbi:MAG: MlaD family protein [Alphaproteobacteria bacterium]|jgi:phospholipid/cholesterol/gamma-HCH transport system substrate-binding protein|nr:MlaD family protein [Alphaproteobacteria bacterium]MDP6781587.1 MlaD family protein [Alphaproteobacteria bacterium]MDP7045231.1 MlaD family protein [Alphaproteobacteria bacterium]HAQ32795.1 hypothetical protein [Rhodospirillaceae bacterium]|tara:strand:+ start:4103 stop:5113 length:1011 start_codon:yes stop_codon:yes gene_type:complete